MDYYNEIEPFCCAVLQTQIDKGNLPYGIVDPRDIRAVQPDELRQYRHIHLFAGIGGFAKGFVDAQFPADQRVLTFGFPCQDLSVAGKRDGLSASRSGLFFEAARLIGGVKPDWFICENVPGLLSSNQGKDFQLVIQTLSDLGYGLAWRILDSQYFGVAQRRRRVFIVGCLGRPCPAEILFESQSSEGYPTEGRKTGQRITEEIAQSLTQSCWKRHDDDDTDTLIAGTLQRSARGIPSTDEVAGGHCIVAKPLDARCSAEWRGEDHDTYIVASPLRHNDGGSDGGGPRGGSGENLVVAPIGCGLSKLRHDQDGYPEHLVSTPYDSYGVRDFAGLPEGMDSPRYKALGNAVTTKTVRWIAGRLKTCVENSVNV